MESGFQEQLGASVETLRQFLVEMGETTNQGAVGLVIDREYLETQFPQRDESDG